MIVLRAPDWALLACVPVLIVALAMSDGARARRLDPPVSGAVVAASDKTTTAASMR